MGVEAEYLSLVSGRGGELGVSMAAMCLAAVNDLHDYKEKVELKKTSK